MKNRVNNDRNNNSTCWYFSSAYPLLLVVVFTLTASILSLQPQRVKIKSSRSSFNNNYCFNFKGCKNKEDATRTSSLFSLKAINSLHHGDEITSGGTANLEDDKDGFEWMKNVDNSNSDGSIYESIVEYDVTRQSIVYECVLGRSLGIEFNQQDGRAVISEVKPMSFADSIGIEKGDIITAIQATAGDQLWEHVTEESVRSALNTRFVMNSSVRLRLERPLNSIDTDKLSTLMVPYYYDVKIRRPLGLHVVEGPNKKVFVQGIKDEGGGARTKTIQIGDQVVSMSASWGDRMWDVNSVESFVVSIRMRSDPVLSFKMKRMMTLAKYIKSSSNRFVRKDYSMSYRSRVMGLEDGQGGDGQGDSSYKDRPAPPPAGFNESIEKCNTQTDLENIWAKLLENRFYGITVDNYSVNMVMSKALSLDLPKLAVRMFEEVYNFEYEPNNPAKDAWKLTGEFNDFEKGSWAESPLADLESAKKKTGVQKFDIRPNNYICTTTIKAYGRLGKSEVALQLVPWMEEQSNDKADIYTLSALLYVCAKEKNIAEAEKIFWDVIPKRNLSYTIATTNSLMYMYAKLNRPDDALRVYEVTKRLQIKCNAQTFGVLVKALLTSQKKQLEETAYEVLASLPSMGISPDVRIYNQFLAHYAKTHDYSNTKKILALMSKSKPRIKPDVISYGHVITCYADAKKPKSALEIYHQMKARRIKPDGYIYMGVLKSLSAMRDGLSAVQVVTEMREAGVVPDSRHISMAMFACVISDSNNLAESLLALYVRIGGQPDTALYSLLLRALLQQGKWNEGYALLKKMSEGNARSRPNFVTCNYLLRSQVIAGRYVEAKETFNLILNAVALMERSVAFAEWQQLEVDSSDFDSLSISGPRIPASSINTKNTSPTRVLKEATEYLSISLGVYSKYLQKIRKEDARHQVNSLDDRGSDSYSEREHSSSSSSSGEEITSSMYKSDSLSEYGFPPDQPLGTPSKEALNFLVDCTAIMAGIAGNPIPGQFYQELLRAVVSVEGNGEMTTRLLDLGKNKINISREDIMTISKLEDAARRVVQGSRMAPSLYSADGGAD